MDISLLFKICILLFLLQIQITRLTILMNNPTIFWEITGNHIEWIGTNRPVEDK